MSEQESSGGVSEVAKVAQEIKPGRVNKVITLDDQGERLGEYSQQMTVDPFTTSYRHSGLLEPPMSLEQLVDLAEIHPTHSATIEQKAADIVGTGWEWVGEKEARGTDTSERDILDDWIKSMGEGARSDETTHEVLLRAWSDVETLGHGCVELARDPQGKMRFWYSMPAHTVRFHRDNIRCAQIKNEKRHWFKRWVPGKDGKKDPVEVDRVTGKVYPDGGCPPNRRANEIFVIKRPSRRSSYYGAPLYVSATGWLHLSNAARDDNILFFENRREPRWAITLENVEDNPEVEERLRRAFQVDLKRPHRNIIIPLSGPAKINFQKLGDNNGDMSWEKLQDRCDAAILIAHRMPGERIGLVRVGALGGSVVADTSRVYKESIVQTSQSLLAARINKLIESEAGIKRPSWVWVPEKLDLTEESAVQDNASRGFTSGIFKLNEARERVGEEPLAEDDSRGEKFLWELNPQAQAAAQMAGGDPAAMQQATDELGGQLRSLLNDSPSERPEGTTTAPRRDDGYATDPTEY